MLTLTLDGLEVDPPADFEVALTYCAHDLRSASTREAAFSETATLPPSARNSTALGTPHALSSQMDAPYRKLPAVLRAGGVVVLDGVATLEQASGEGYDLTLYAPTADLFALVKDRQLRELDLSGYDHPLTFAAVQAALGHDYTQGYAYPLADDGRLDRAIDPNGPVLYHEVPPFVFYHALLLAIVAECLPGYTLTGSLLAEDRYRRIGFPRARPWPALRQSIRDGLALSARRVNDVTFTEPSGGDAGKLYAVVPFPEVVRQGAQATWGGASYFVVPAGLPCDVRVTARLRVRVAAGPQAGGAIPSQAGVYARAIADPNGQAVPADTVVGQEVRVWEGFITSGGALPALPAAQVVELDFSFARLPGGSVAAVQLYLHAGMSATVLEGSTVSFAVGERTYVGGPVQLDAGLPDISQADFLQLVANQFQALVQTDAATRTVRFDLLTDLERNRARAVDWTAKLDRTAAPLTSFRLDGYAQSNRYAYDKAPAAYDALQLPADALCLPGLLPVADLTLPVSADAYVAPVFALLGRLVSGARLGWLPAVAKAGDGYRLYDPGKTYTPADAPVVYGARYWRFRYINPAHPAVPAGNAPGYYDYFGVPVWQELAESEVLTTEADELAAVALLSPPPPGFGLAADAPSTAVPFAYGLSSDGLGWETDLLPAYYPGLRALLVRARVLRLPFTLGASDIAALDHTVPVALNVPFWPGVGPVVGLFYVNKVDQYLPGVAGPTAVELIRLGEPVPGLAPAALPLPALPTRLLLEERGAPLHLENTDYLREES